MTSATPARHLAVSAANLLNCLILPLLMACCVTAHATYKCKIDGALTYTDQPCGSESLTLPVAPISRGGTSEDSLHRDRAEIARLQRLREQRERQDQQIRDLAARGAAARERKCKSLTLQLRWREEDVRDATLKEEPKARKRARRAAEKLAQECQ
ncbi:MAG: hypothetical protein ACKOAO_01655 [Oxalobacteraceae bacterium]